MQDIDQNRFPLITVLRRATPIDLSDQICGRVTVRWRTRCFYPARRMMRVPPPPVLGELTSVRPAIGADADLLVRWHRDPEVARYWDNATFTRAQM